jgi:ssDNA-specific exonuclease RecJ
MGMEIDNNTIAFEAVIYEDVVVELRDALQEKAPEAIVFDFTACDDMHLAVVQEVLAYRKLYECEYRFADEQKTYQMVIEGFDVSEDHCS